MKKLGLRKYALSLLKKNGLERDTYRSSNDPDKTTGEQIVATVNELEEDCKKVDESTYNAIFVHPKYSAFDIVRELYAIGDAVKPKKKDKYHLIWDNEHCTDGYDVGNNKKWLKDAMKNRLIEWMGQFGDGELNSTTDDWDYMIYNCGCRCYRNADLTPDCDTDRIWSLGLDYDDERRIGWVTTDEMDDYYYNELAEMYGWPKRKKK